MSIAGGDKPRPYIASSLTPPVVHENTRLCEPPLNGLFRDSPLRRSVAQSLPLCPSVPSSLSPYLLFLYVFAGPFFFCLARSTAEVKARLWGSRDLPFFC